MADARLFLIDAHALCYRAFYAIKGLSTHKGQATNAVYGFINVLKKILREYTPDYMAVCFDSAEKTNRQKKFAEYKIQRPQMPQDLISQIPIVKDVIKAYHMAIFELGGFEADDMIATIAHQVSEKGIEVVIVSDDKDMYQLANSKIKFLSSRSEAIFCHQDIKNRLGIEPEQITDFIGLAGDKVDNIPGVFGIGEVTARNLINQYGSLDNVLARVDEITPLKVREKISSQKESAILSKQLAVLETNAPIAFDLDKLKVRPPDQNRLFELFKELEFKKWAEELEIQDKGQQEVVFRRVETEADRTALIARIHKEGRMAMAFDFVEEASRLPSIESMEGVASLKPAGCPVALAVGNEELFCLTFDQLKFFKEVLEDEKILKIAHDVKASLRVLFSKGIKVQGPFFDVMLASYLLAPSQTSFDIGTLAWIYLKSPAGGHGSIVRKAGIVYRLYFLLLHELKEKGLIKLFEDIEMPLARVLFRMEDQGVNIDLELLNRLSAECDQKIKDMTSRLYDLSGGEFNLNSPKQLSHILFEKLGLPVVKKIKTGFSTDESVLTKLAEGHFFPSLILEYRQLSKLKSTYIDALPKLIDPKIGRVHTHFDQTGTETGRLSSRQPNLQNIPIRTELGRQIRKAIIPSAKELTIISADYSQIELRILAHLSLDENLITAFRQDQDIHTYTASLMFDVKEGEVTPQMRTSAKRVNFGIIYGMSAFGLAKDLNIPQTEAQDFIDRYFLRYPGVKKFMDGVIKECEKSGYVLTLLNRRRYIPEINSANPAIKQLAQRQAINTPVQGSAADLMKLAMIHIQQEIERRKLRTKMIITVHDELVFESPQAEMAEMIALVRDLMEHPMELIVPIKVSIKTGVNWLDLRELVDGLPQK
ncbi:MAG TPA: DNA polymerase I [Candidatus Omnitrophica bacterium]|nr:MAG: DNA polymerase I [Omnitrophica WOR_2 bacterium GWA2_45_18]OGX20123.1 MAG: DNA polymerase I [Omnitrophica WOR_2 bacterium GWC2_45_7]HBR15219.1 DNA polymerase I [Candidatus Omnitrophota bacterium]